MKRKSTKEFSLLSQFSHLQHGMSTKIWGDMRDSERRKVFLQSLDITPAHAIVPKQVHGINIALINKENKHDTVQVDGLLTIEPDIFLSIVTADCVPIFFYEAKSGMCGIAHAGWKGTLGRIAQHMVQEIVSLGGSAQNLYIGIGAHIGGCCYVVDEERINMFREEFGENEQALPVFDGKHCLDLGYINKQQLIEISIPASHIESPITCTSCQNEYFSFRKDTKRDFGEMLSIIGMVA